MNALLALARCVDAADHNLPLMIWFCAEPVISESAEAAVKLIEHSRAGILREFTARRIAPQWLDSLVDYLNGSPDWAAQRDVVLGITAALQGQRSVKAPEGWDKFQTKISQSDMRELHLLTLALSLKFGSATAPVELKKVATNVTESTDHRRAAFKALLAAKDPSLPPMLHQWLNESALRSDALRGLAHYDDLATPEMILKHYSRFNFEERRVALTTLATRGSFARSLVAAWDNGTISSAELSTEIVHQLRNLKDAEVNAKLEKLWGVTRETGADKLKLIENYIHVWRLGYSQQGDASRGRLLFQRNCQSCHTLFDAGGKLGPDLTGANRSSIEYLIQNIVDPNAAIPNDYRAWTLETTDGRVVSGLIARQDAQSVTLQTSTEALIFPRNEIQSLQQSELSLMPEGLIDPLTDQEVRDLLYYLTRPGQVPFPRTEQN